MKCLIWACVHDVCVKRTQVSVVGRKILGRWDTGFQRNSEENCMAHYTVHTHTDKGKCQRSIIFPCPYQFVFSNKKKRNNIE